MEYLLRAAKQCIESMVKESFDAMLIDFDQDVDSYINHYGEMGRLLFKINSYTEMSDLIKDIENGEWGVAMLDAQDDEGIIQFFDTVAKGGQHYLDEYKKTVPPF